MLLLMVVACGDAPLASIGDRSAEWINEPEVTTTTRPTIDLPTTVSSRELSWFNDSIVSGDLSEPSEVIAGVFARREGDRYIQASRFEVVAVVPDMVFPANVPYGATWVSSQLVLENTGRLSSEPTAAFGIWSATPYTRSRSVAQMAVIRVANDPETAADLLLPGAEISCGRFAEQTTQGCSVIESNGKMIWLLASPSGATLIWFEGDFRYELFGRPFIPVEVLVEMATVTLPLSDLNLPVAPPPSEASR